MYNKNLNINNPLTYVYGNTILSLPLFAYNAKPRYQQA